MKKLLCIILSITMVLSICACNVHDSVGKPCTGSHDYGTYVYNNDATCFNDGTETASCKNKYCSSTHTRVKNGTKLKHSIIFVESSQSTCVIPGYLAHYECEYCNTFYSDQSGQNVINPSDIASPLKQHQPVFVAKTESSCCVNGVEQHYKCTVCEVLFLDATATDMVTLQQLILPLSQHVWEDKFTVDFPATKYSNGEKSRHCVFYELCHSRTEITVLLREDDDGWIGA